MSNNADYNGSVYPALVEQIDPARRTSTRPGSGAAGTVEDALRDVLGWRPKADDPGGFTAALAASFTLREVDGHIESAYVQRNYAVQLQADMGAVTGAQASLYSRAKNALEHALPLLSGLTPLKPAADPEDAGATREIVQSLFTDLVDELGAVGGPRCQRVESLLEQLVGSLAAADPVNPDTVGGQLGELRTRFGFEREDIGRLAEEQNLTNYWILVEYVGDVRRSYLDNRRYFSRSAQPGANDAFLGTQLVLLSRQLALVADTVEETNFVLDSVFVDAAQRQTIWLEFTNPDLGPRLSMFELLDWVSRVATREGPRLIQDAGRDGLGSLTGSLARLNDLLDAVVDKKQLSNAGDLPRSVRSERVRRALQELRLQVREARRLAAAVARSPQVAPGPAPAPLVPRLDGVDVEPPGGQGDYLVTARGEDFSGQAELRLLLDDGAVYQLTMRTWAPQELTATLPGRWGDALAGERLQVEVRNEPAGPASAQVTLWPHRPAAQP